MAVGAQVALCFIGLSISASFSVYCSLGWLHPIRSRGTIRVRQVPCYLALAAAIAVVALRRLCVALLWCLVRESARSHARHRGLRSLSSQSDRDQLGHAVVVSR
jgi:hypothetical protein